MDKELLTASVRGQSSGWVNEYKTQATAKKAFGFDKPANYDLSLKKMKN